MDKKDYIIESQQRIIDNLHQQLDAVILRLNFIVSHSSHPEVKGNDETCPVCQAQGALYDIKEIYGKLN